jgi:hypothetical protein
MLSINEKNSMDIVQLKDTPNSMLGLTSCLTICVYIVVQEAGGIPGSSSIKQLPPIG